MTTTAAVAADAGLGTAHIAGTEVILGLENGQNTEPNRAQPYRAREKNTKRVRGRRAVRFESYQDLVNDAAVLVATGARALGNWNVGQVFAHLAQAIDFSISGFPSAAPWWVRLAAPLFRRRILRGPMPAGFKSPYPAAQPDLAFESVSPAEGFAMLERAVARVQLDTERALHPVFGELSLDEWDQFHLRHAELHASFLIPLAEAREIPVTFVGTQAT